MKTLRRAFQLISIFSAMSTIAAVLLGHPASAEALRKVTLRLDYLPTGYHAPLFLGVAEGLYRDVGIDLEIADGKGTNPALQSVSAGNDMIVLANYSTMIESIGKGMPVKAIGGLIQRLPDSVFALAGNGIVGPKDLEGRVLGLSPSSAIFRLFPAFAKAANIDASKVKIIQMQPSASLSSLLNGQVDAAAGWAFTDALKVAAQKPIAPPMMMADYGISVLGVGFVVRTDTAASQADLLRRFMSATGEAYSRGVADPEAAIDSMMAQRPTLDRAVNLEQLKRLAPFLHTAKSEGHPFGWTSLEDWQQTYDIMQKYFDFSETVDISNVFTNEFVGR